MIDDDGLPDCLPHQVRLGSLWLVAEGRATRLADSRAVDVPDGITPDTAPDESTKDKLMSPRRRSLDALRMSSGGKALIGIRSGLPGAVSRLFTRRISGMQGSLQFEVAVAPVAYDANPLRLQLYAAISSIGLSLIDSPEDR